MDYVTVGDTVGLLRLSNLLVRLMIFQRSASGSYLYSGWIGQVIIRDIR